MADQGGEADWRLRVANTEKRTSLLERLRFLRAVYIHSCSQTQNKILFVNLEM